jgi:8-oxo-dGTP pyrophosphatase MutT (NUDIX family)
MATPPRQILIAAGLLVGPDGRVLLVRKRGTTAFMQPGGKIEAGEAAEAALRRELGEELALVFAPDAAVYLGRFEAPAAHEAGATVTAEVFRLAVDSQLMPQAEIEEIRWIDPADPGPIEMAALTRDHILPAHRRRS